jgi:undecaprenyl pyrophosphate phosphatase UppP
MMLYIGPDVFLPITSALAAIAGVLLMFWHRIVGFARKLFGRAPTPPSPPDAPVEGKRE